MNNTFFPPRPPANPTIYAYKLVGVSTHKDWLKVGYTGRNAKDRIAEQLKTSRVQYKIGLEESAIRPDGSTFTDHDIETIINKSEAVKKTKKEANERELSPKEKKELSDEEKEYKNVRKQIQEKLIKFATRIPVFMYLTDYRERSLKDVITQLEPGLFKKVTGLSVKDFELLVSLGVFNSALMNDAVYKFKRYEDASLEYIGINKHDGQNVGLYDTVLSAEDYEQILFNETEVQLN